MVTRLVLIASAALRINARRRATLDTQRTAPADRVRAYLDRRAARIQRRWPAARLEL